MQKKRQESQRLLLQLTRSKLQKRSARRQQERSKSERESVQKSVRLSTRAKLREHARNRSATLKKHRKMPKKASARPYSNKELKRGRNIVLQLCRVVVLLISHPQHLHVQ